MKKFNIFKFKYGVEKKSIFHYAKLGIILEGGIDLISILPFFNREQVFNYVDIVQEKFNIDLLNDYIIKHPELLEFRIKRLLDKAEVEYFKNEN